MNAVIDIDNKLRSLEIANDNFKSIIKKTKNKKFSYLDSWMLKTSDEFKKENENENNNNKTHFRLNYGTIVKADFGINQGAELSNPHFAIVLDRFDNIRSETITVIPLTSKNNGKRIALGKLISQEYEKNIRTELKKLETHLENSKKKNDKETVGKILLEISKVNKIKNYYLKHPKNTYANISQIRTISKDKLIKPLNKYDILNKAKCSNDIMSQISDAISKNFLKS